MYILMLEFTTDFYMTADLAYQQGNEVITEFLTTPFLTTTQMKSGLSSTCLSTSNCAM